MLLYYQPTYGGVNVVALLDIRVKANTYMSNGHDSLKEQIDWRDHVEKRILNL